MSQAFCWALNCGRVLSFFTSLPLEECRRMMKVCWERRGVSDFVVSSLVSLGMIPSMSLLECKACVLVPRTGLSEGNGGVWFHKGAFS